MLNEKEPTREKLVDFNNFTDESLTCLIFAEQEAQRLNNLTLSTFSLLLGILRAKDEADFDFPKVPHLTVDYKQTEELVRNMLVETEPQSQNYQAFGDERVPFTTAGKRAIELAANAARERGSKNVEPVHLLIGVLGASWVQEGELKHCRAYDLLERLGVDMKQLMTDLEQ